MSGEPAGSDDLRRENRALKRALAVLSGFSRVLLGARAEEDLLRQTCEVLVDDGGFRLAWVGYVAHDAAGRVKPVARAGLDEGYVDGLEITWREGEERGAGPTGRAIQSGRPVVARDIGSDPNFGPWREGARRRGFGSSIALPLRLEEDILGALNIYSEQADAFNEAERGFLAELADNLAFGIGALRDRQSRRSLEGRLQQVVQKMPVLMDAFDEKGTIVAWNRAAERVTGWSAEEVVGNPEAIELLYPDPEYRERMLLDWERRGHDYLDWEWELTAKDGSKKIVSWSNLSDRFPIAGWASWGVGVDVTDRARGEEENSRLEEVFRESQRLESLGLLAGGVAHDFNNLLTAVLGNAELALAQLEPDSLIREDLKNITTSARRASDLANQLLAYSGRGKLEIETVDLSSLVHEMSHLVEVSVSKKAEVEYDLALGLPGIEADPTQLRQVILNLITNAADAVAAGGTIRLTSGMVDPPLTESPGDLLLEPSAAGPFAFLRVEDDGCGMKEETRRRIFDPFFTTKSGGRGLGLAAVLGIVRRHGGTIEVESVPGKGSTFTVLLPVSDRAPELSGSTATRAGLWQGEGLLLVADDEAAARDVARRMLEFLGFEVLLAESGGQAVELFRRHRSRIRAIILDLRMGPIGGEEALAGVRSLRPEVPVILTSGYTERTRDSSGSAETSTAFLQKPYRIKELRDLLRQLLE